jgi:hypothetical protein
MQFTMQKSVLISIPFALGFLSISSSASANILSNSGFESGNIGWSGTAINYFHYTCGTQAALRAKDGNCYAFFEDASGTSLSQNITSKHSGTYEASVAVNGQGSVRFVIWTFCPGFSPQSHGYTDGVQLDEASWKTLKVRTVSSVNGCELKWELYIDTNSKVRVDAARLYQTF